MSNNYILNTVNYHLALDNVQVTPNVTGVELNDPKIFGNDTNAISISRLSMDPNTGFEKHVHPHNHVLVFLEGGGRLDYTDPDGNDHSLEFKAGDVLNVPGVWQHAVSAGPEGILMLSIGSPPMHLLDPERMVFIEEEHKWMVPTKIEDVHSHDHDDAAH
jgi:mannose-6-phosphate isomerase-like protein (cupin superfamily)